MHRSFIAICLFYSTAVVADLLGPSYPSPTDLSSDQSLVTTSWQNASQTLLDSINAAGDSSSFTAIQNLTFSLGMFSLYDDNATALQFHYTSPEIRTSPNGTHNVDADSIYRVASITKVFTVLAGLLELELADWERPLSEIIPTLAAQLNGSEDPINSVAWDKITPSALAAQMAGVPRDGFPAPGELTSLVITGKYTFADFLQFGFPPIADNDTREYQPCYPFLLNGTTCPPEPYVDGIGASPPTFLPWTTPAYSDAGFTLLGQAIEAIAGRPLYDVYMSDIFAPLNMTSSNSTTPPESEWHRCVIPGDPFTSGFALEAGAAVSSGGLLSTTTDLARFGRAVLNSTLLPAEDTRRWLKPVSHTARLQYAVGRPWEIMRYVHPATGKVTDLYTKLGDSGNYSGFLVLIPDYGAGFSILSSRTILSPAATVEEIVDLVIEAVLPALEAQAAAEAECNLAGIYTSTDASVNSSITLALNHSVGAAPGLHVMSWVSNGTDLLHSDLAIVQNMLGPQPLRLVPGTEDIAGGKRSFWLVNAYDAPNAPVGAGRLVSAPGFALADWMGVDTPAYGGLAIRKLVFDVAEDGRATALSPSAFRIVLEREVKS